MIKGFGTGTWAVVVAALAGKPVGVLAAVALAAAAGLRLPYRVGWRELTVIAFTASIGCTFGLFFATAAIPIGPVLAEAKLGALLTVAGSLLAMAAAFVLRVGRFARASSGDVLQRPFPPRRRFVGVRPGEPQGEGLGDAEVSFGSGAFIVHGTNGRDRPSVWLAHVTSQSAWRAAGLFEPVRKDDG